MSSLYERIKAKDDRPPVAVEIPEWGETVFVRTIGGSEMDRIELEGTASKLTRARIAILVTCDETGARLFSDDDESWLNDKSSSALNRIVEAFQKQAGVTAQEVDSLVEKSEGASISG